MNKDRIIKILLGVMIVVPLIFLYLDNSDYAIWTTIIDFVLILFIILFSAKIKFTRINEFLKLSERKLTIIGYLFLIIAISVLSISTYIFIRYNGINFKDYGIGYNKIYSIGTYFGGVVAPLLTFSTVCFLASNYIRSKNKDELDKWKNHVEKIIDKYRECYSPMMVIVSEELMTFDFTKILTIENIKHISNVLTKIKGNIGKDDLEVSEVIRILSHTYYTYSYIVAEITTCPLESEDKFEEMSSLMSYLMTVLGDTFVNHSLLYIVLNDIYFNDKLSFKNYVRILLPPEEIMMVAKDYGFSDDWDPYYLEYKNSDDKCWVDHGYGKGNTKEK